jgi:hypothetical protein
MDLVLHILKKRLLEMKELFCVALLGCAPVFAATPCIIGVSAGQQWTGDMDVPAGAICQVQAGATVTGFRGIAYACSAC